MEGSKQDRSAELTAIQPWKARSVLAISLVLAFAVPYISIKLLFLYQDRQWLRSGLSPYEISRWRDSGISDVHEAVRWRNARFQPPGAKLWKDEGIDPEAAGRWHDLNFSPREARRWSESGFTPADAAPWRDQGFLYQDAKKWREAGVSAAEAAKKRKRGIFSP